MVVVRGLVPVEHDVGARVVGYQHVDIPVALHVEAGDAPALGVVGQADVPGAFPKDDVAGSGVVEKPDGIVAVVLALHDVPAVDVQDVDVPVVVEVRRAGTPCPAAVVHLGRHREVPELPGAVVAVEPVAELAPALDVEVVDGGDEPVHVAVAVVVADRGTHAGLVDDDVLIGDVGECAVAVVQEDLALLEVGCHQEVAVAVVVDVAEVRGERPVGVLFDQGGGYSRLDACVRECAVAVVAPDGLGVLARIVVVAPMREKEVDESVPVVVEERRGDRVHRGQPDAGCLGCVDESSFGLLEPVLEDVVRVADDGADEQVEVAITIDVTECRAASPVREVEAEFGTDLLERPVAAIAVEVIGRLVAADDVEVHVPVGVHVGGRDPTAQEFRVGHLRDHVAERATENGLGVALEDQRVSFGDRQGCDGSGRRRWRRRGPRPPAATADNQGRQPDQPAKHPHVGSRARGSAVGPIASCRAASGTARRSGGVRSARRWRTQIPECRSRPGCSARSR